MTTELRELLTLAARAMGFDSRGSFEHSDCSGIYIVHPVLNDDAGAYVKWKPHSDSSDCARMCAALGIDSIWWDTYVRCEFDDIDADVREHFRDHNNDRSAAWRLAALRVAAEIGKGMNE